MASKKKKERPTATAESPLSGAERRKRAYEQFKQIYYALKPEKRTLPVLSLKTGIGFRLLKEEYLPMLEAEEDEAETESNYAIKNPEADFDKIKAVSDAQTPDPVTNPLIRRY